MIEKCAGLLAEMMTDMTIVMMIDTMTDMTIATTIDMTTASHAEARRVRQEMAQLQETAHQEMVAHPEVAAHQEAQVLHPETARLQEVHHPEVQLQEAETAEETVAPEMVATAARKRKTAQRQ